MIDQVFFNQAAAVLAVCRAKGLIIATAESCTGGLVSAALTAIPGSSDIVDRGFVTYSNAAKMEMLGVPPELLHQWGAVSEQVAIAMAEGAIRNSSASLAVAVTGIAGPSGSSDAKPVGLVHFAALTSFGGVAHVERRLGNIGREDVRKRSVTQALELLRRLAQEHVLTA
jgi:nicotinamide-nucleotide amidase